MGSPSPYRSYGHHPLRCGAVLRRRKSRGSYEPALSWRHHPLRCGAVLRSRGRGIAPSSTSLCHHPLRCGAVLRRNTKIAAILAAIIIAVIIPCVAGQFFEAPPGAVCRRRAYRHHPLRCGAVLRSESCELSSFLAQLSSSPALRGSSSKEGVAWDHVTEASLSSSPALRGSSSKLRMVSFPCGNSTASSSPALRGSSSKGTPIIAHWDAFAQAVCAVGVIRVVFCGMKQADHSRSEPFLRSTTGLRGMLV